MSAHFAVGVYFIKENRGKITFYRGLFASNIFMRSSKRSYW